MHYTHIHIVISAPKIPTSNNSHLIRNWLCSELMDPKMIHSKDLCLSALSKKRFFFRSLWMCVCARARATNYVWCCCCVFFSLYLLYYWLLFSFSFLSTTYFLIVISLPRGILILVIGKHLFSLFGSVVCAPSKDIYTYIYIHSALTFISVHSHARLLVHSYPSMYSGLLYESQLKISSNIHLIAC